MNLPANLLQQNNALASLSQQAGDKVTNAVYGASQKTGVDFSYLMQQAQIESSFRPEVQAKTSSATGLYQFIDSTWLDMVKQHGEKYGIDTNQSRAELLKLRKNPELSANMAAEFANGNQEYLEKHWAKGQKNVGSTELYMAHFMGAGGAAAFLNARDDNPMQPAAELFERAAKANKSIFFESGSKRARSLDEVYELFARKFQDIESGDTRIASTSSSSQTTAPTPVMSDYAGPTFAESRGQLYNNGRGENGGYQSLFSNRMQSDNVENNVRWLKMSSLDFVNLLKSG